MQATGLAKDALHVHVGLAVLVGALILFRWRLGDRRALAIAVMAAVLGEAWDVWDVVRTDQQPFWPGHVHDLWNTTLWPLLLTVLARLGVLRAWGRKPL